MLKLSKTVHLLHVEKEAEQILACFKPLIQYIRDKKNRKVGILLAYKDSDDELMIGWSKCNIKRDRFNRDLAITKAFDRRMQSHLYNSYSFYITLPHSIRDQFAKFVSRSQKFFFPQEME